MLTRSFILLFITSFLFFACHTHDAKVTQSTISNSKSYPLVHQVFFKLKKGTDIKGLITEIKKLNNIPVLKHLEIGTFADLKDPRALSDYGLMMQMRFANEIDFQTYQTHPIHIALKEKGKAYLGGPPVTYDYIEVDH